MPAHGFTDVLNASHSPAARRRHRSGSRRRGGARSFARSPTRFGHQFDLRERAHRRRRAAARACRRCPTTTLAAARSADAILLGAVGDPAFDTAPPSERPESALLTIRRELGLYANLRPARVWPGLEAAGPLKPEVLAGTDLLVVRELTGGLYYGEPRGIARRRRAARSTRCATRATRSSASRGAAFEAARLAAQARDLGRQGERARRRRGSGARSSPRSRSDYPDVTLDHMLVDTVRDEARLAPSSLRRHPHREHVRRHPVGRGRRGRRLARPAAVGQPRRRRRAVRAGARLGARTSPARTSRIRSATIASAAMLLRYALRLEDGSARASKRRSRRALAPACAPPTSPSRRHAVGTRAMTDRSSRR